MKSRIAFSVLLWIFPFLVANAGNGVGNGGGAWVCRETGGAIRWIRLVDLYEAESNFGLHLTPYTGSVEEVVLAAQIRLMNSDGFVGLTPFIEKLNYLKEGTPGITFSDLPLPFIDDAFFYEEPFSALCEGGKVDYEQVVRYVDGGSITVQRQLLGSLSKVDQAALIVHEGTYAYRRKLGDSNSANTRRIVGLAFSDLSLQALGEALQPLETAPNLRVLPGTLMVTVGQIDEMGTLSSLTGVTVSVEGESENPLSKPSSFNFTQVLQGTDTAMIQIPLSVGPSGLRGGSIAIDFEDVQLSGWIAPPGWSVDLTDSSNHTADSSRVCEANTVTLPNGISPGNIAIICMKK